MSAHQRIVDAEHPWLGLESFTEATQRYFFGRDREIAEIFVRTRENPLTILYGQSGLGKTSLLGAGLIPKLKVEGLRPGLVRLRYENNDPLLIDQVKEALAKILATDEAPARFEKSATLWEILHHIESRPGDLAIHPPVLIFDQFEEVFTLGQRAERLAQVRALFTELADLVENRPPIGVKQRFQEDRKLVREYDLTPSPLRLVITLREDYLSHLEAWKRLLPSLMRNRTALHLLNGPQALEAVLLPGQLGVHPLVDPDTAARIVRFVANRGSNVPLDEIGAVPPLLSLVCDELNSQRIERREDTIRTERSLIPGSADTSVEADDVLEARSRAILHRFYQRSFAGFPSGVQSFVEDRMVTTGGHRCPVSRDDAVAALEKCRAKDAGATLQTLVTRRLISTEERGGVQWFEITHDVLVPIVRDSRDKRLARQRFRRLLVASFSLLALLGFFAGITIWAVAKQREAESERAKAAAQRDEARYNEGLAWMLRAQVAEERKNQYPSTLLFAAQAIGFEGVGRPTNAPAELLRYLRRDRNPEAWSNALDWITSRPAYLPIWSSPTNAASATALSISSEGRRLALSRADGSVSVWDFRDGRENTILTPGTGRVDDLAFHPNAQDLTVATDRALRTWNLSQATFTAEVANSATRIAWSPAGDILAAAARDGSLHFWQNGKLTTIGTNQAQSAASLAYAADNSIVAVGFPGVGIRVAFPSHAALAHAWNQLSATQVTNVDEQERPALLSLVRQSAQCASLAVHPNGRWLVSGGIDGSILLWDVATAKLVGQAAQENRHQGRVHAMAFRPDGQQFASGSADGFIRLWSVNAEQVPVVVATLVGHAGAVTALQYAPGGGVLASAGADGGARLWSVSGEKARTADLYSYLSQQFYRLDPASPKGLLWVGGSGSANVPPTSLAGIWSAGGAEASARLLETKEWTGALALRSPDASVLTRDLLADARSAAKSNRWHQVQLRLKQLQTLGATADAAELQQQRAAFGNPGQPFTNANGLTLLWCPPTTGEGFLMGSPTNEAGRQSYENQHLVKLSGYWLSKYELSQPQWSAIMGYNRSTYQKKLGDGELPAENMSWNEAMDFCRRLTDFERAAGTLPPGWEYTLPSEAQWEYACLSGAKHTAYSFGEDPKDLHLHGNYNDKTGNFTGNDPDHDDGKEYTAPVGSYRPNPWGFHDMHGNVWEWCVDSIDPANPRYPLASDQDPVSMANLAGASRVDRGGGFIYPAVDCRAAARYASAPSSRSSYLGLRPALVRSSTIRKEGEAAASRSKR